MNSFIKSVLFTDPPIIVYQKAADAGLLLTNNNIRAQKQMVFSVTRQVFKLESLPTELRGFGVGLPEILTWTIRECRLHNAAPSNMTFNLKLDGRPLAGTKCKSAFH